MSKIDKKTDYLFECWDDFIEKIKKTKHIIVLLDFDGTLALIAAKPEYAVLSKKMKNILVALAKKDKFSLGIISGRSLKNVEKLVNIKNIYYAGNHGVEIKGPDIDFCFPGLFKVENALDILVESFKKKYKAIEGVIIENKGFSLSVHYRLVNEKNVDKVKNIFNKLTEPLVSKGEIKLMSGKKVLEIVPLIDWNKGNAVKLIEEKLYLTKNKEQCITIYMGDDKTDEYAFEALLNKGISIRVRKLENSKAKYFVKDNGEVEKFLTKLGDLK